MENRVSRRPAMDGAASLTRIAMMPALGALLALAPLGTAVAQGSCKGTPREGTAVCDTTPYKAPFAPTGWKTVALDHFTMQAQDYKKEVGFYAALMNWKVRSDDGQQAVLDIGPAATVIVRGGYTPPAPPPRNPAADSAAAARGGRAGRGGFGNRPPVAALWDGMAVQIAPWDAKKVEAALKERGLNPVEEHGPNGYEGFLVHDPDGFNVIITNGAYAKARKAGAKAAEVSETLPFDRTNWQTDWLDHISFAVTNYKESTAWYQALLGWIPQGDEGSQNETWLCADCGNILIRGGNPNDTSRPKPAVRRALINHISFGITPFDPDAVKADLEKRGLNARMDTGTRKDIHDPTANYKSYHTTTPAGWDLQISNANKVNRTVKP